MERVLAGAAADVEDVADDLALLGEPHDLGLRGGRCPTAACRPGRRPRSRVAARRTCAFLALPRAPAQGRVEGTPAPAAERRGRRRAVGRLGCRGGAAGARFRRRCSAPPPVGPSRGARRRPAVPRAPLGAPPRPALPRALRAGDRGGDPRDAGGVPGRALADLPARRRRSSRSSPSSLALPVLARRRAPTGSRRPPRRRSSPRARRARRAHLPLGRLPPERLLLPRPPAAERAHRGGRPGPDVALFLAVAAAFVAVDVAAGAWFIRRFAVAGGAPGRSRSRSRSSPPRERIYGATLTYFGGPAIFAASTVLPLQPPVRMSTIARRVFGKRAQADPFAGHRAPRSGSPPASRRRRSGSTRTPDVLFVVAESLPADHLDARTMPNLWRARGGRRPLHAPLRRRELDELHALHAHVRAAGAEARGDGGRRAAGRCSSRRSRRTATR